MDHVEDAVRETMTGVESILFVPWALADLDGYTASVRDRLERMGFSVSGIQEHDDPIAAASGAEAIFVGGGNTFRLLSRLYETGVMPAIRERVAAGMPYM